MNFSQQAQVRHTLIRLGGLVLLLLLLNGLIGLGAIRYSSQTSLQDLDALEAIADAEDLALTALSEFKTQVQEWKNILLRGDSAADLAKYRAAFDQQHAQVQSHLKALQALAPEAGLLNLDLDQVAAEHAALKPGYETALAPFIANQGATPRETDAKVRGKDRALTDRLEVIAASAAEQALALRDAIAESAEARYRTIMLYTLIANAVIAALVILILLTSLKTKSARTPRS
jgi:hypothetical protein